MLTYECKCICVYDINMFYGIPIMLFKLQIPQQGSESYEPSYYYVIQIDNNYLAY